jgi:hypothetical protein
VSAELGKMIGFRAGTYPASEGFSLFSGNMYVNNNFIQTNVSSFAVSSSDPTHLFSYSVRSTSSPAITAPQFKQVYYKPNNAAFSQQGAQMSSAETSRIIYNTVSASKTKNNKKFPTKQTPVFKPFATAPTKCQNFLIR